MGKTKHHRATTGQQPQAAVKPEIKHMPEDPKPTCNATREPRWAVGSDAQILKDYLDMKDLPEENGLANCGYLVLRKSDVVRILYAGSAQTDDPGWLYGEVIQCLSRSGVGRRGWLPAAIVEPPPELETPPPPTSVVGTASSSESEALKKTNEKRSVVHGPLVSSASRSSAVSVQRPSAIVDHTSPPAPCTLSAAFAVASKKNSRNQQSGKSSAKASQSHQQSAVSSKEAFPALPGHSGQVWWEEEEEESQVNLCERSSQLQTPSSEPPPRDVKAAIARHRALAAAAAAKDKGGGKSTKKSQDPKNQATCPICMEPFTAQRRRAQLPCCNVSLCMLCSEKSIKGGRCYFCRETADEFPSLVASTGLSRG